MTEPTYDPGWKPEYPDQGKTRVWLATLAFVLFVLWLVAFTWMMVGLAK